MEGPRDYHTKWSKLDRERQTYDIAYTWNLKKKRHSELISKIQRDSQTHKKQNSGYHKRKEGGGDKLGVLD